MATFLQPLFSMVAIYYSFQDSTGKLEASLGQRINEKDLVSSIVPGVAASRGRGTLMELHTAFVVLSRSMYSDLPNSSTCVFIFFQEKICPVRAY